MKISVRLSSEDVTFLDNYAKKHGYASRARVVHEAIRRLREDELVSAYAAAWSEWTATDMDFWEASARDGLN